MAPSSKLSFTIAEHDVAHTVVGALQDLTDPIPDAVTLFEDGPAAWRVEAYFPHPPDVAALAGRLEALVDRPLPALEVATVPDLNWVKVSQAALPPVAAGRFSIHGSHDRGRIPYGPNAILIDAGEAFGTAHHATTLGCLLAIDRLTRSRTFHRVLDLGCGSGVLAIAAARALPKAEILATDFDPQSIAVAAMNMRANGVHQRIAVARADGLAHPWLRHAAPFDLVIANILAGPLRALAPGLGKVVCPGGTVVLAGLLVPEAPAVIAAYRAQGFLLLEHRRIDGWLILTLVRGG